MSKLKNTHVNTLMEKITNEKRLNTEIAYLKEANKLTTKEISDTHHTFGDLYNHRMALNVAVTKAIKIIGRPDIYTYKSLKHHDDSMFEGMFIVVIESPIGQISYHYDTEHWNKFNIAIVPNAETYDGHTPNDTIERLIKLL
jgi:hypothetical protein